MAKLIPGQNDLATTHPEIAAQAHGWDPTTLSAGSNKKMAWECSTGHPFFTWVSTVSNRTNGNECPLCARQAVLVGFNDLLTTHPEIAAQAHGWDPTTVSAGSNKKMSWECSAGHPFFTWETQVAGRTSGHGCPLCSGKKVLVGFNDLLTTHPEIAAQAHGWDPTTVSAGSNKKMAWECSTGHPLGTWEATVNSRTRGTGCPICANKKVLVGFNDLLTTHPDIAAQAHGWDPSTVTAGAGKKLAWECSSGHPFFTWEVTVDSRVSKVTGCPVCAGKKVLIGFNDLLTRHPEIAAQAHGWDPETVTSGSNKRLSWECSSGHPSYVWKAKVAHRASGSGCPVCAGQALLVGFNDLLTKHPDIAAQAHGWDPKKVHAGSQQKMVWKCDSGHPIYTWETSVQHRTSRRTGCPVCASQALLVGFNDLLTKHPDIAAQAHGWDPATVHFGSEQKLAWECSEGHPFFIWEATVSNRTKRGSYCPLCASNGKALLVGFNDLLTTHPEIAAQAHGWDPTTVSAGSHKKMAWKCSTEHPLGTWEATVNSRTQGRGCPICADYGYKRDENGYLYLMERVGEQQIGITNEPEIRIKTHERDGWELIELAGPFSGELALSREGELKEWLKGSIGTLEGTTENWDINRLQVKSLEELYAHAGLLNLDC